MPTDDDDDDDDDDAADAACGSCCFMLFPILHLILHRSLSAKDWRPRPPRGDTLTPQSCFLL